MKAAASGPSRCFGPLRPYTAESCSLSAPLAVAPLRLVFVLGVGHAGYGSGGGGVGHMGVLAPALAMTLAGTGNTTVRRARAQHAQHAHTHCTHTRKMAQDLREVGLRVAHEGQFACRATKPSDDTGRQAQHTLCYSTPSRDRRQRPSQLFR